jgi:hypothetical protein
MSGAFSPDINSERPTNRVIAPAPDARNPRAICPPAGSDRKLTSGFLKTSLIGYGRTLAAAAYLKAKLSKTSSKRPEMARTCKAVLAETGFHLQSVSIRLAMIHAGLITLAFDCNDHLAQLDAMAKRF